LCSENSHPKGEKERRMHGKKGKKIQNSIKFKNTRVYKKNREKLCHLGDFCTTQEQQ
jgi:hypothetical protein